MNTKATVKRMKEYKRAVMRLGGENIGPNVKKDAMETAAVMNELEYCTTLFVLGLGVTYRASHISISNDSDSKSWIVTCITRDGKRFRAEAETLAEAAIAIGKQTGGS